jgi:hypothetical protein
MMFILTQDQLTQVVDGLADYLEEKYGKRLVVKLAIEEIKHVLDTAGIPALLEYLKNKGVIG